MLEALNVHPFSSSLKKHIESDLTIGLPLSYHQKQSVRTVNTSILKLHLIVDTKTDRRMKNELELSTLRLCASAYQ